MAPTSVSPPPLPLRPPKANMHKVYSTSISVLKPQFEQNMFMVAANSGSLFLSQLSSRCTVLTIGTSLQYKVALCQLLVSPDKEENIARARSRIEAAAETGAVLIVMPASRPLSPHSFFS
jgi:hypothetical protein